MNNQSINSVLLVGKCTARLLLIFGYHRLMRLSSHKDSCPVPLKHIADPILECSDFLLCCAHVYVLLLFCILCPAFFLKTLKGAFLPSY